jgi:hypothetical protein
LADYRRGRFDSASEWADYTVDGYAPRRAAALFVQAAALARLQQFEAARALLAKGEQLTGDYQGDADWSICKFLRREARELIERKSASSPDLDGKAGEGQRIFPESTGELRIRCSELQKEGKWAELEPPLRTVLAKQRKLLGDESRQVLETIGCLTAALCGEGKWAEAEALTREGLALGEKKFPDEWQTFSLQATLGASLLGQKRYRESEPLLLAGYEGLKQRQSKLPEVDKPRLKGAILDLVHLYEETSRPEPAAHWRQVLGETERASAQRPESRKPF